ncbi:unnamed protein product [Calicophoron daubneyi]
MSKSKTNGPPPSFYVRLPDEDDFGREISTAFDSWGLEELSFPGQSSGTLWREIASMGKYFDINVHDNHGCSKVIRIDELTTAAEVCTRFDRYIDLCTSQLYEEVADLPGLMHPIEDHQFVLDIISKWPQDLHGFRLSVRENLDKYSPFSESAGAYHQLWNSSSILELFDYEEQRILSGRWSTMSMPDPPKLRKTLPPYVTSGLLWFHPRRRPWKKYFCFLHGEAIYFSPTPHNIASRDMRLLVDLGTMDVFHAKPQSTPSFRTPTRYVIVCRPTTSHVLDSKVLTTFATRTFAGQKAWENGMRIHKFGYSRLEANYREAVKTAKIAPPQISRPSLYDPTHFDGGYIDENSLEKSTRF